MKTAHLSEKEARKLYEIIESCPNLFAEQKEKLTYTTVVKVEIRTTTEEPVFTKSYPYATCLKDEIDSKIHELLRDGIIRKSRSPYNSPV